MTDNNTPDHVDPALARRTAAKNLLAALQAPYDGLVRVVRQLSADGQHDAARAVAGIADRLNSFAGTLTPDALPTEHGDLAFTTPVGEA